MTVAAATACGLLIGIERGFRLRTLRDGTRVAGVRTFTLLGCLSGIAGFLSTIGQPMVAAAIVGGAAAVLIVGYAHQPDLGKRPDATTPIAGMVTLGLGFTAAFWSPALAIAAATIVTLLLALRQEEHRLIRKLDQDDIKALARFAVIAGAILPFLPSGQYGPFGAWNPQKLWLVVVAVTGFSFLGYAANRIFGERHGTVATALIGGVYSSTAVTQSLAHRLGSTDGSGAEAAGIALATAVMYLRVLILVAILASRFLVPLAVIVIPAFLVAAGAGAWLLRAVSRGDAPAPEGNPIALVPALSFLLFVAIAAVAAAWARGRFGEEGLAILLVITGSMDVDVAIVTAGGLPGHALAPLVGAIALAGAIIINMGVKLGITIAYGRANAKPAAFALAASLFALAATMALMWMSVSD